MAHDVTAPVPIAVIGMSCLLPGGEDVGAFWRTVVTGRDLITELPDTHWSAGDYFDPDPSAADKVHAKRGGFLAPVDFAPLAFGTPPSSLATTDTAQLLALHAADAVLREVHDGPLPEHVRDRTGVVLGAIALEMLHHMSSRMQRPVWEAGLRAQGLDEYVVREVCDRIAEQYVPWRPESFPGLLSNVVAGRIANRFDLHGLNHTVDAACASSLSALSVAIGELALGRADLMITGGVDTLNDITTYMCFGKSQVLSPTGECRPFSDDADGTILGEGLAMFALKRLSDAERDGDAVYAVLRGVGTASDGKGDAVHAPVAAGQVRALRRAYDAAGYGPETVELVEAHGTGTVAGDATEVAALLEVFGGSGRDGSWCALGSVKSQIGHAKAAAGAAGLIKTVLALHQRVLPPTIKVRAPRPASGPFYVNTTARPWVRDSRHPRRSAVSSFGFGGSDYHVTVEEYTGANRPRRWRVAATELVLLCGGSVEELGDALAHGTDFSEIARRSQETFDPGAPRRLALVAPDLETARSTLASVLRAVRGDEDGEITFPAGAYSGRPGRRGPVAFLFPGQGSQYPNMGAGLLLHHERALQAWDAAADVPLGDRPLHDVVFPRPHAEDHDAGLLDHTEWTQPSLAAHSLALLNLLHDLGLTADRAAGHSSGELVALHHAGAFDAESLLRLARVRGELMSQAGEPGAMLALNCPIEAAEKLITDTGGSRLWPANRNGPEQIVASGAVRDIDALEALARDRGVRVKRLPVSVAAHTPLMAPAAERLRAAAEAIPMSVLRVPVHANANGLPYPADPGSVPERLAAHLCGPVLFADTIEAMYGEGVRTFVEVGPGSALTGLVDGVLGAREHLAVSLDHRDQDSETALQTAMGRLAVRGVELDFAALWRDVRAPRPAAPAAMTVPITGANGHRPERPAPTPTARVRTSETSPTTSEPADQRKPVTAPHQPSAEWLRTLQEMQRATSEAHATVQQTIAGTHLAYLRTAEEALRGLVSAVTGTATPSSPPPAAAPRPWPALAAPPPAREPVWTPAPTSVEPLPVEPLPAPAEVPSTVSAPAPAPVPAEAAPAVTTDQDVAEVMLKIVAELTGYPVDMLDADMRLDGELGVDSIKRVQIMSTLRERMPDLPPLGTGDIGSLRTVRQVAERFSTAAPRRAGRTPAATRTSAATGDTAEEGDPARPLARLTSRQAPARPPGSALGGLHRHPVTIVGGPGGWGGELAEALRQRGIGATASATQPHDARSVIHLAGLADPASVDEVLAVQRTVFEAARRFARAPGDGVFVVVLDSGDDPTAPRALLGGLAALARTLDLEWPEVSAKAVDCGHRDPAALADELCLGGADRDVTLRADGTRLRRELVVATATTGTPVVDERSVVVITGGARGVTATVGLELARTCRPRLALFGRSPLVVEDDELAATPDMAVRAALARRANGRDLAEVGRNAATVTASRQVRATLAELDALGVEHRYVAVDVTDRAALGDALDEVRRTWGPITGLVHGAGVVHDKLVADKTDEQFATVFAAKVDGLRALLDLTATDPLELVCAFSSVAAWSGNRGQADYAMANHAVEHLLAVHHAAHPGRTVRALAWGPWDHGMVTPELAEVFRADDVPLISARAGARAFLRELGTAGDPAVLLLPDARTTSLTRSPRTSEVVVTGRSDPQLADHVIAGAPVVPIAMITEWFVRAAQGRDLRKVRVLRPLRAAGFPDSPHRIVITAEHGTVRLSTADGTAVATARITDDLAPAQDRESRPGGGRPPCADTPYTEPVLFHGPLFRALRQVHAIGAEGAVSSIDGLGSLGWPDQPWHTDPALVDGGIQTAVLWAWHEAGLSTLPMGIDAVHVHRSGPAEGPVRCLVRPVAVHDHHVVCDVLLTDTDGSPHADLLGVELVARPDAGPGERR
ncbi:SDR family NAD(P)-dependent oxidoreductase [Saccharothrix xinjiangensis]|uniref:SDR family NAD(P)-dependent oxidoreductase n=1 Tax=Saccharothrix xinjiangensis TaxID=204798 RepID=A0ABV9Y3I5_9PSEU